MLMTNIINIRMVVKTIYVYYLVYLLVKIVMKKKRLLNLYLVVKLKIYLVIIFFNYWFYLVFSFNKRRICN